MHLKPTVKMVKLFSAFLFIASFLLISSCDKRKPASPEAQLRFQRITPRPVSATAGDGTFTITADTRILTAGEGGELAGIANYLAAKLRTATGFAIAVAEEDGKSGAGSIILRLNDADGQQPEGYTLAVEDERVTITASAPVGIFWGVQTLRQLLPEEVEKDTPSTIDWDIATGTIQDHPQYGWRGSMLDVARHFFTVDDVKRYIDLISMYKMNILHLHLSDDQGWRIEIKSWPNLTSIGGRTEVGGAEGGYYTQEEYRDIVAYAASRFITIVPEIDMPGHINAALVSYRELLPGPSINREPGSPGTNKPKPGEVYTGVQVGFSTLDYKKDITFQFVSDVLREMASMTPGPYLHIGGDEAAVTKKPDYIAFINRFKTIVASNNKKMIGWEEIAQADIDSTVIVQHWHSQQYATMAADKGAKLIYSPAQKIYLDMQYDSATRLGLHWAGYSDVDSAYLWNPETHVPGVDASQILGVEAPLWTETLDTMDDLEYMLFPRLPGVAELGWTPSKDRSWNDYKQRLAHQAKRWEILNIDYYRSPKIPWEAEADTVTAQQ